MRKFILFFVATIFVMAGYSQTRSYTMPQGSYYYEFPVGASDTIIKSTNKTYQILLNKVEPVRMQMSVDIDSISGNGTDTLILQGRVFDTDSWTTIADSIYSGTGIVKLESIAADNYYRYIRLYVGATSTTGKNKLAAIKVKIWRLH